MRKVFLTFDVEDFIWPDSMLFLKLLLSRLERYDLTALFFITGYMAEKLKEQKHKKIVDMLCRHKIGYHSSSHSVHPAIYEFTDIESYEEAYRTSLVRETSHINYLTGEIEGKGGILALRSLFDNNEIISFRAPGFCWSPPHSEALRDIGLKFDFSANIAPHPVLHRGITFYPFPDSSYYEGTFKHYWNILSKVNNQPITILVLHPALFVYTKHWDFAYYKGNPKFLANPGPRLLSEFRSRIYDLDVFLKWIHYYRNTGLIETTPDLEAASSFNPPVNSVEKICEHSIAWPKQFFKYTPQFLPNHFSRFFSTVN